MEFYRRLIKTMELQWNNHKRKNNEQNAGAKKKAQTDKKKKSEGGVKCKEMIKTQCQECTTALN